MGFQARELCVHNLPSSDSKIRGVFPCGNTAKTRKVFFLWNPEPWALKSGNQHKKSGIPSADKESGIQYLETGIHSVESGIKIVLIMHENNNFAREAHFFVHFFSVSARL